MLVELNRAKLLGLPAKMGISVNLMGQTLIWLVIDRASLTILGMSSWGYTSDFGMRSNPSS